MSARMRLLASDRADSMMACASRPAVSISVPIEAFASEAVTVCRGPFPFELSRFAGVFPPAARERARFAGVFRVGCRERAWLHREAFLSEPRFLRWSSAAPAEGARKWPRSPRRWILRRT